jgi:hypothetical protein
MPAFLAGLIEDLTKQVSALRRLGFTALSALLGAWLLDASITRTEVPGLDWIASFEFGAAALAVFAVAGVANSVNIIDGMNGLASMCVAIMLAGLAYVALQVGDTLIASLAITVIGATLGFFLWNYPNRRRPVRNGIANITYRHRVLLFSPERKRTRTTSGKRYRRLTSSRYQRKTVTLTEFSPIPHRQ